MAKFTAYMRGEGVLGPTGNPAGFGTPIVSTTSLLDSRDATVSITTISNSPDTAKVFKFDFGIPKGADFDKPVANVTQVASNAPANVSVTSSGPVYNKKFTFNFEIPAGISNAGYKQINFTTTSNGTGYSWNGTILQINRTLSGSSGYSNIIPITIYKQVGNDYKAIAAEFTLNNTYIYYKADEKFTGVIYCMAAG
jgi:hypothetical protein